MSREQITKQLRKLSQKMAAVVGKPADDKIWADNAFWSGRWQEMVAREADLHEQAAKQWP